MSSISKDKILFLDDLVREKGNLTKSLAKNVDVNFLLHYESCNPPCLVQVLSFVKRILTSTSNGYFPQKHEKMTHAIVL